jgi:2'-5' RNA ligase
MTQEEIPRRLFVGLRPPDHVLHEIERVIGPHRPQRDGWRWTPRDEWHVTLRFLGSTTLARPIATVMAAVASRTPAFSAQFGGFGAFAAPHRAHTLWLGLDQGEHRVAALERALSPSLDKLGFQPERRRFSPHLTLCRIREETDARMALVELDRTRLAVRWMVEELVLFESMGGAAGERYVALAVGRLARPTR